MECAVAADQAAGDCAAGLFVPVYAAAAATRARSQRKISLAYNGLRDGAGAALPGLRCLCVCAGALSLWRRGDGRHGRRLCTVCAHGLLPVGCGGGDQSDCRANVADSLRGKPRRARAVRPDEPADGGDPGLGLLADAAVYSGVRPEHAAPADAVGHGDDRPAAGADVDQVRTPRCAHLYPGLRGDA